MDALDKLIEAVEAGDWDRKDLLHVIDKAMPQDNRGCMAMAHQAYHGSLDAALAMHEALLPGWSLLIHGGHHGARDFGAELEKVMKDNRRMRGSGRASTPARAWLLAVLKAYRSLKNAAN